MLKTPWILRKEGQKEAYQYFDRHIRSLPKDKNGHIDKKLAKLSNNDVDAFRHAYTSGIIVQEYKNSFIADILGQANEIFRPNNPKEQVNMDLWNNAIGRKYGKETTSRKELADKLKKALENGELIISPKDPRKYKEDNYKIDPLNSVVVIKESDKGRNEIFLDLKTEQIMTREEFVVQINSGSYPGYTVAMIEHLPTPKSKPDDSPLNNLG